MPTPATRRVRSLAVTLLFAMIASMAVAIPGIATPAAAAVNTDIVVNNLRLIHIDAAENERPGQLNHSAIALLKWDWDATSATVKEGDSFAIALPDVFTYRRQATEAMYFDFKDGNGQQQVGDCVMTKRRMECTFNALMAQKVAAGYGSIAGDGKVHLSPVGVTTAEEVPFTINDDKTVNVDLPGEGGIRGPNAATYTAQRLTKGSTGMDEDSTQANWRINFGTAQLSAANGVVYDGTTVQTITFNDTLGAGMACLDQTRINNATLLAERSRELPDRTNFVLDRGAAGSTTTSEGEFTLTLECGTTNVDGTTPITIKATGPFDPDSNYTVAYSTAVSSENGKAVPGFTYENKVAVEGTDLSYTGSRTFVRSFSITVRMEAGFGNFRVTKYVKGTGASQVTAGAKFPVTVKYELPAGATADDYPTWTAPGTLNADRRTGTVTFDAVYGSLTPFPTPFPVGTTVTLSEDLSGTTAPAGYEWGTPEFSETTLTIENQVEKPVNLTNHVNLTPNVFQVVKNTDDTPGAKAKDYTFDYTCSDGSTGTITAKGDGVAVQSDKTFPVGTTCTVTEKTDAAGIDGYTLDDSAAQPQTVTIGLTSQDTATATFTNTYAQDMGHFSVTKRVVADASYVAPESYMFSYTCTAAGKPDITGRMSVAVTKVADGYEAETEQSDAIPVGYTCSVTEDRAEAPGYTDSVEIGAPVTITKDAVQDITVTNIYTRETGSFSVAKTVVGGQESFKGESFTFDYTCTDGSNGSLQVPGDGTAVNSDKTFPTGTECTVTEKAGTADRDGYTVVSEVSDGGKVTIAKDTVVALTATNTYTRQMGTFEVAKVVTGDYTPTSTDTFKVTYTCDDPDATTGTLDLPANGNPVTGPTLPTGTSCTITEEAASVARDGYALATSYSEGSVMVVEGSTPSVTVTNTYTALKGGFTISKTVDGDGASLAADAEFTFDYTCKPTAGGADHTGSVTLKGGETASVPDVPVGPCVVTERDATLADAELTTTLSVDGTPAPGGEASFAVSDGATVQVAATNTYTRHRGSFSVAKTVVGGQESFKGESFTFDYTCSDGSNGSLQVPGDGTAVNSDKTFPTGTECTVTEKAGTADRDGYTVVSEVSDGGKVTIAKDTVVALSATNTYTEVPAPTPEPTEDPTQAPTESSTPAPATSSTPAKPGKPLAKTGASILVPLLLAGAAIGGGALLVARRRHNEA